MCPSPITRRRALSGAATVGLSLPILSACGSDESTPTASDPAGSTPSATGTPSASGSPSTSPSTTAPGGSGVVATADVPVGSGVILADDGVVVTQPTEGDVHVFSNVCTHQGCPVTGVSSSIDCSCHGSTFDLTTGEVTGGPATVALSPVDFTVEGGEVVLS